MRLETGKRAYLRVLGLLVLTMAGSAAPAATGGHAALVELFEEWRAFERPPLLDGVPDYTEASLARQLAGLQDYRTRLAALDPAGWPLEHRIDHALVMAQLNGHDFNLRVLRPWARDPAFYQSVWTEQSDTPAHEGPFHHALVELWTYQFPLSEAAQSRLAGELRTIPPLLRQARGNLTGNARDLWLTGIGTLQQQGSALAELAARVPQATSAELRDAIADAQRATGEFVAWLEQQAPSKTGPSGIGKENYDWSLRHVHLVPMTWEQEVTLLQRELARAYASLRLEEQRNRGLPPLTAAASPEQYARKANEAVTKYMAFLKSTNLLGVEDYLDPALRAHIGEYSPPETRNFFAIASHYEPITLYAHFQHWFDHAWMKHAPHPSAIRREAILFNVWDSRAEGMATAMEEIVLHAGYYDDNPRAREIVWIMLAQRCARGLASLYAHANQFDLQQAKAFQVEWTPRGWMRPDLDLLGFEQQLYLRQPGYGTSYVTGKYLVEELIRAHSQQLGEQFSMRRFFDELNAAGVIPMSLIHWQVTGQPPAGLDLH
jgi:hypothetical protein